MLQFNDTHFIYGNSVNYDVPPADGVVNRQTIYNIQVFCLISREGRPTEPFEPDVQTVPPQFGDGEPVIKIVLFETNRFRWVERAALARLNITTLLN